MKGQKINYEDYSKYDGKRVWIEFSFHDIGYDSETEHEYYEKINRLSEEYIDDLYLVINNSFINYNEDIPLGFSFNLIDGVYEWIDEK